MFKVNNKDTRTTPCRSGAFIVNFEHISNIVLGFLLLTLKRQMPAGNWGITLTRDFKVLEVTRCMQHFGHYIKIVRCLGRKTFRKIS